MLGTCHACYQVPIMLGTCHACCQVAVMFSVHFVADEQGAQIERYLGKCVAGRRRLLTEREDAVLHVLLKLSSFLI